MNRPTTALVLSTDDVFAPLAKGLVLSILGQAEPREFDLKLVDIGCSAETLDWMRSHGVEIKRFNRKQFTPRYEHALRRYQDAQFCRPYLPRLFPQYDVYIWCDADVWIQDVDSIRLYRDLAAASVDKVIISPIVDVSYDYIYKDFSEFSGYSKVWFNECYGETVSSTYFNRAVFSSGVFSMHCNCPLWNLWETEIDRVYRRNFSSHMISHVGEQVALNYLIYAHDCVVPLCAEHNYNCHIGNLYRNDAGEVVVDRPPYRKIGIIHLSYSSKMMKSYIEKGLLYECGEYLTDDEKSALLQLSHY
jgi:lipopolysaccharide biosynthesis glycosyltransferase